MLALNEYPAEMGKPVYGDEMHGDVKVPLVSVYVTVGMGATDLEAIKSGLCGALFVKLDSNDSRATVGPFARRFATMEPVKLEDEYPGYRMTVHGDLASDSQAWADVEVGKISIDPHEGGGVDLKFRAQMRGDMSTLTPLLFMMGREVQMTLEPPKAAPLPPEHPDFPKDGLQFDQPPIGEGASPAEDPFLVGMRTVDVGDAFGEGTQATVSGAPGPLLDGMVSKATAKRTKRDTAH